MIGVLRGTVVSDCSSITVVYDNKIDEFHLNKQNEIKHLNTDFIKNNCNTDFIERNTYIRTNDSSNISYTTTATVPYIRGTSETIASILRPYSIRVAHKPMFTLRRLLTNVKGKDKPEHRTNRSSGFLNFQLTKITTWIWRWLPHRLSKRQALTTVPLRTPITQMMFFNQGMLLLGSSHFLVIEFVITLSSYPSIT